MLTNYFKIALRNMRRRSFFSFLNIAGLGIGLSACWLIGLYVWHENNYDHYLPNADRICAVALDLRMGEEAAKTTNTPPPVGPRLLADFPEIELTARSFHLGSVVVKRNQSGHAPLVFNEDNALAVDTSYLPLFGFPMAVGAGYSALCKPGSLVLTETMAQKYFGEEEAVGQSLVVNDRVFNITGVIKDLPANSTVQFGFLLPIQDFRVVERFSWSWIWLQVDTWVRLRQTPSTASLAALEAKFPAMIRNYAPAAFERIGQNFEENLKRGDRYDLKLLPLLSLHLNQSGLDSRLTTLGDGEQVRLFGIVGALILLLACVNFMNLSTARSVQRAREVGVRKALGSQRGALIGQFLSEALLFSVAAMVLAFGVSFSALPFFNQLTGYSWTAGDLFAPQLLGFVLVLPLLTTFLGGLYPAFYLSGFRSSEIFKMASSTSKGGHAGVRSGLVVFQFAVSVVLMLCSFVVYQQLDFAQKQSPGLVRDNVLVIENMRLMESASAKQAFREQLLQLPEVQSVTHATYLPSLGSFGDFYEPEQGTQSHSVVTNLPISSYLSDSEFVPTLGIEIKEGRNFMPNAAIDSSAVILNEAAIKAIGWEGGLGQWMRYPGNGNQRFQVVGIMKDFHVGSVRMNIEPVAIFHESSQTYQTWGSYMAVRLKPDTEKTAIDKATAIWAASVPGAPFEYDFLDASFANLYRSETKMAAVLGIFMVLALVIGCLGLFGLAAFAAERRVKEIGIRKVLGATVLGITSLLAKDFLKLVVLAILIAAPVAYYFMQKWLSNFVYHINIQWWIFAVAGLAALGIAFLTVAGQSIKSALTNPVESLRSE
jgi:putative ABC transport system permease protein